MKYCKSNSFSVIIKRVFFHSELRDSGKGMSQTMTKGRKTTLEERIEIVKACIANEKNYQETAETIWGFLPTNISMGEEI